MMQLDGTTDALLAISIVWGFIFIYAVMASMDFGAGFWSMIYMNKKQLKATNIANRYLSPTWEVTNVFIVGIVVALFSFFPGGTFVLGTVLLLPGSIILLLLAIRSGFLVFSHAAKDYERALTYVSGISGFIIPAVLILVLPVTHGNFVYQVDGNHQLDFINLFLSPHAYSFMGFAIFSTLFLSSLLLADFSNVAGEKDAYQVYRRNALITGPLALLMSFSIMMTMRTEARWLYTKMMDGLPWLILSFLLFLVAFAALFLPNRHNSDRQESLASPSSPLHCSILRRAMCTGERTFLTWSILMSRFNQASPRRRHSGRCSSPISSVLLFYSPAFIISGNCS